jgi:arginyl-tRNA synthetase
MSSIDPLGGLRDRVLAAARTALGDEAAGDDPALHRSQHADYQADLALALAKRAKKNPREVATAIAAKLAADEIIEKVEVSGPGFLNLTLRADYLARLVTTMGADARLGVARVAAPETIVVDYSAPNVAKEMHVGHLRSTIIGDSIVRLLEFQGHKVVRRNHVGDWGTPFGMLIEHLLDTGEHSADAELLRTDPNTFYAQARRKFDSDPAFVERSRARIVRLQGGDPETMRIWQELVDLSRGYLRDTYELLRVTLTDDDIRGESFYNDMLADTADQLVAKGLAVVSDGALCVFPAGFTGRDGSPLPVIIRKSDGGWNYSTTDLATIRYRVDKLNVDRAIYVVGSDQALHFRMVFAVAKEAGWLPAGKDFAHAQIGMVQGKDGHRLRTRAGDNVKLSDLLAEGVERAKTLLIGRAQEQLDEAERDESLDLDAIAAIAEDVGIGAIKYADLSTSRDSAYIFDWDRMISFKGNTGPYLQYATTRIRSIFRKAGIDEATPGGPIVITAPAERELALKLLSFGTVVTQVADAAEPHQLGTYLFEVASLFTTFYEQCPVLKAEDEEIKESRLALCAAVLRVLTTGLDLLGVPLPDRM